MATPPKSRAGNLITALALTVLALAGLWVAGRLTHIFDFYVVPTPSNSPTFEVGDHFLASRWLPARNLDFIAYYPELAGSENTIFFHRLCGQAGDTVEIRRGTLYLNGRAADAGLSLAHHYTLARADYARLPASCYRDTVLAEMGPDSLRHLGLADLEVAQNKLRAVREVLPATQVEEQISRQFGRPGNQDNFGPVVVPPGCWFVLGDNRQNALDSRYIGWVRRYVATVLH